MTSLRTFQNEIDQIHSREAAKQRAGTVAQREKEKDTRKASVNTKEQDVRYEHIEGKDNDIFDSQEVEEKIQSLLLSELPVHMNTVRDMLSALITRNRGEYIFRLGSRPPLSLLYLGELTDSSERWSGIPRTKEDILSLQDALKSRVEEIGGQTSVLFKIDSGHPRVSLLLRLPPLSVSLTPEVRCAVVGNVDSGKSTTLGVLTRGGLDDGRGRARVALFRHKHELETGRTSSVGMEILGFGPSGAAILPVGTHLVEGNVMKREKLGWEEISIQAAKIVSFSDLAGHERYLKTTLYGLTSGAPSCVILIIAANAGLIGMSKEHLAIALALSVPVVVCITKIDMTPPNILTETVKQVVKILKSPGCRKTPVFVESAEVAVEVSQTFAKERQCPIFQISNVTGESLDFVRTFLNLLPSSEVDEDKFSSNQPFEYSVTEVWSVPYVGTVVNGIVNCGRAKVGDAILFGPDFNGHYESTTIKDMQRKRAPVTVAEAGQCVSFALKRVQRSAVRKGMVIVHKTDTPPRGIRRFEGQLLILYHNTTLQTNYQAMLHCGAVRQTVKIVDMDHPRGVLRTGDRATVSLEFISHPEFIKEGMKFLIREGKTKGLGVITRLL